MTDWTTIADLGTAAGTLVLAAATFAAVRSSNQSARLAERTLLAGLRPLLLPSRREDPPEKIGFQDDHWLKVPGGQAAAEATDEVIYFGIAVRNYGTGVAVLAGWRFYPDRMVGLTARPDVADFRRLTRDLYIPPSGLGFWQGALRDPAEQLFAEAADVIKTRRAFAVDVLYGDGEGGQRVVTRFTVMPMRDGGWMTAVGRHWNLDRADPR
jgi:hypothetical protein